MTLCSQLENGCAGVFVFAVNSRSPKVELNLILNPLRQSHMPFYLIYKFIYLWSHTLLVFLSTLVITQILWRVDGTKGTIQVERGVDSGKHGYQVKRPFFLNISVELMLATFAALFMQLHCTVIKAFPLCFIFTIL